MVAKCALPPRYLRNSQQISRFPKLHGLVRRHSLRSPAHGYELKASFGQTLDEQRGGLNIGHLYQVLGRLARDGLLAYARG